MNCGNLLAVSKALREKFPSREIIVCADNDQFTDGNPGVTKAAEAAKAIRAKLAVPQFADASTRPTDFNDMAALAGLAEVKRQIETAAIIETSEPVAGANGKEANSAADSFADSEAANDLPGNDDPLEIDALPLAESALILEMLAGRKFDYDKPPPHTEPRFFIGEIPVSTVGNLTTISALIKSGKTATICAAMASAMTTDTSAHNLGWRSSNPNGLAIIHFDTEQSPEDHYAVAKRAVDRAGLKNAPAWFVSYRLTGCTLRESRMAIEVALSEAAKAHGGIHSVFLDGSADFIANVNDADESNDFVAAIRKLSVHYTCPILAAIHVNPNGEKTRGHLGSELERKAESNLKLRT